MLDLCKYFTVHTLIIAKENMSKNRIINNHQFEDQKNK